SQTTRGFTGEEQLQVASLVHLNGRVYDSLLARFTSADPTVTDPTNPQGWNRYSYVGNDPLAFTDPNGFSWLSGFFHSVSHFFTSVGNFLKTNAIARAIFQIGVTVLLNVALPGLGFAAGSLSLAVASAAGGAAITAGVTGGNLSQVLKAGLIAGVTAAAFFEVGVLTYGPAHASPGFDSPNFSASNYLENIAGHALVGCGSLRPPVENAVQALSRVLLARQPRQPLAVPVVCFQMRKPISGNASAGPLCPLPWAASLH